MSIQLKCVVTIVDVHKGSTVSKIGHETGVLQTAIMLGVGTIGNRFLSALGLDELRKEICVSLVDAKNEAAYYDALDSKMKLYKPGHGIAFTCDLETVNLEQVAYEQGRSIMKAIFAIVENGASDAVIEASKKQGAPGGTIIHGRGSTNDECAVLFGVEIEPEKEIIFILAQPDQADAIMTQIHSDLLMDEPGNGIVFSMGVSKTLGLFQK